jgi:hypothetical protein
MFPRPKEQQAIHPVKYFRVKTLGIFSLFHVPKIDTAVLLACLEYLDKDFSQQINLSSFAEVFCPTWKETFQALWKRFVIIFTDSRNYSQLKKNSSNLDHYQGLLEQLTLPPLPHQSGQGKGQEKDSVVNESEQLLSASYTELIAFLFFLISVDDLSSSFWLYWLWYTLPQQKITRAGLIDMVDILWGQEGSTKTKSASDHAKQSKEHRILLKPLVKYLEPDDFNSKKFQLLDWRCHRGFTVPFISLRKELMTMIGSKALWRRLLVNMNQLIEDPSLVIERLGRKKGKSLTISHRASRSITRQYLSGERKEGWFELRDFIESFLQFHQTLRADPPEPKGPIDRLVFSVTKKVHFAAETMKTMLPSSRRLPHKNEELELLRESGDGIPDDNSLTKLYRKTMKLSVKRLHEMSDERRERGLEGLARCREELEMKIEFADEEEEGEDEEESKEDGSEVETSTTTPKNGAEEAEEGGEEEEEEGESEYEEDEEEDYEEEEEAEEEEAEEEEEGELGDGETEDRVEEEEVQEID